MPFSVKLYEEIDKLSPDLKSVMLEFMQEIERNREESVRRADFEEMRKIVTDLTGCIKELAVAQKGTEERLRFLSEKVEALAEAQRHTEERLNSLTQRVEALAEAQRHTEERLNSLTQRVEALAEAQKRTELALRRLVEEHTETRKQLGGLSATVGYHLEDRAFRSLPGLLKSKYGIKVEGRLLRKYIEGRKGEFIEVNIFGQGKKNGSDIIIVGESKAQLSKTDVDEFLKKKLNRLPFKADVFPIVVTYMISQPDAEDYARKKGVTVFYSYDFEL